MTTIEIKTEIQKVLETVPEDVLPSVLAYLKEVQTESLANTKHAVNLKQILSEDKELLQKLAQ